MLGKIFILGDSYSTFGGYIPEGYSAYYGESGPCYVKNNPEYTMSEADVCKVNQTWWYNICTEYGKLEKNCSWSGTTICNTGYDGCDNSDKSFIARLEKLINEGYFEKNKIDTFFLFGGTNDSWSGAPIGDGMDNGWTKEDLYKVLPAFSYLINLITKNLFDTKVYCILHSELKDEIYSYYKEVCENNNIDTIELKDIDKVYGHPTVKGMMQIQSQVLGFIKA